jgi:BASS family bile acid:Na+ symporter
MSGIVAIVLPACIMLAMFVVGLEITFADLARVGRYPGQVAADLAGQALLLPPIAVGLILWLEPAPAVSGGLILLVASPQATTSGFFCLLGRANVALSVTLTAMSSLLALIVTPLVARIAFEIVLGRDNGFDLPIVPVMQQVLGGLLLPVTAGMLVRHRRPGFVARHRPRIQRLASGLIVAMLAIIAVDQGTAIVRHLGAILLVGALFTAAAVAVALAVARVLHYSWDDTVTAVAGFPLRSLSVAALISVNVLERTDFLAFAAPFFLVQAALLVPVMILARRRRTQDGDGPGGT